MSSWYETEKGYRRKKSSFYLRQHIHEQLVNLQKNQLSFSETANRLLEHPPFAVVIIIFVFIQSITISSSKVKIFPLFLDIKIRTFLVQNSKQKT